MRSVRGEERMHFVKSPDRESAPQTRMMVSLTAVDKNRRAEHAGAGPAERESRRMACSDQRHRLARQAVSGAESICRYNPQEI